MYWCVRGRHRRTASPEEICALFILHTVKANRLTALRVKKNKASTMQPAGGPSKLFASRGARPAVGSTNMQQEADSRVTPAPQHSRARGSRVIVPARSSHMSPPIESRSFHTLHQHDSNHVGHGSQIRPVAQHHSSLGQHAHSPPPHDNQHLLLPGGVPQAENSEASPPVSPLPMSPSPAPMHSKLVSTSL